MNSGILYNEIREVNNPSLENYKSIKPETNQSTKEINNFWKDEFSSVAAQKSKNEFSSAEVYKDDNGKIYREGNRLIPDNTYEKNGYAYETDKSGRIISAEGKLKIRDDTYNRNMEDVRKIDSQEYHENDDRGHLIGHQFGGSDRLENLIPMDANLNKGDYAKVEHTLADAVKDGRNVGLKIQPQYEGDSTRPSQFRIFYSIDGDEELVVLKNESEIEHD